MKTKTPWPSWWIAIFSVVLFSPFGSLLLTWQNLKRINYKHIHTKRFVAITVLILIIFTAFVVISDITDTNKAAIRPISYLFSAYFPLIHAKKIKNWEAFNFQKAKLDWYFVLWGILGLGLQSTLFYLSAFLFSLFNLSIFRGV